MDEWYGEETAMEEAVSPNAIEGMRRWVRGRESVEERGGCKRREGKERKGKKSESECE